MAAACLGLFGATPPSSAAEPQLRAELLSATLTDATVAPSAFARTALAQTALPQPALATATSTQTTWFAQAPLPLRQATSAGLIDISMRPVGDAAPRLETAAFVQPQPGAPLAGPEPAVLRSVAPDLFGSVALLVGHTPEDGKWMRARAYEPSAAAGPWSGMVQRARRMGALERVAAVNAFVNHQIAYATPEAQYGVADYWATAAESLTSGRGNCTAYAIAKLELLRAAGVPVSDLYLVLVRDLVRRADHAIVAVRLNDQFVILDSGSDAVLSQRDVADYRPVLTYGYGRTWIHGYRETPPASPQETPAVMMAQATPAPAPVTLQ